MIPCLGSQCGAVRGADCQDCIAHTHAHTHTHNTTLQVTPNVKPVSDGPLKFDEVMANYDYCMDWVAKMYVLLFFVF